MYPYDIFLDIGLYEICIILGLIVAMVIFRILADKRGLSAKLQNTVLIGIPFALFVGYPSAVAVQWVYNGIRDGEFTASIFAASTGSTFYGGLIGGSLAFLGFYFVCGHLRIPSKEHLSHFPSILEIGPACIAAGHALGRVGCFFAGCCHGIRTDSFLGVYLKNPEVPYKVLPVQLFEAAFLTVLCAFLIIRFLDGKRYALPSYLILYGIWRFSIEYLRGDDRGQTFVSFLTPSQLTAILLILLGIALIFVFRKTIYRKKAEEASATAEEADKTECPSAVEAPSAETTPSAPSESPEKPESGDGA